MEEGGSRENHTSIYLLKKENKSIITIINMETKFLIITGLISLSRVMRTG